MGVRSWWGRRGWGGRGSADRRAAELARLVDAAEQLALSGRWRADLRTGEVIWSDQVFRVCGLPVAPSAPPPEVSIELFHEEDRAPLFAAFQRCCDDGASYQVECRLIRPDGEIRRVINKGEPERDASGRIVAVHGVFLDVTESRRVDEQLRRSERVYRELAEHSSDVITTYGPDSAIRSISPACRAVLGYEPEALIGTRILDLMHPDDRREVTAAFQAHIAAGPRSERPVIQWRARHAEGGWVWLEGRPTVRFDDRGRPFEMHDVARDISARKAAETELAAAREAAEAANIAKGDFLANMSHELRTPLTSIIGFAGLLEQADDLGPNSRRQVTKIITASQALLTLVNDVLDFSKLEAGALELDPQPFSPSRVVAETVDILQAQAESKRLVLEHHVSERTPEALVGDAGRLRQVLLNLISNAVKFTAEGKVSVVMKSEALGDRTCLHVAVTDTGIGIAPEQSARLFERFVQADGGVARRFGGTGLGLSICKRLVELMGGEIGVESRPGLGSTFWFSVTLDAAEQAPSAPELLKDASGRRVLVADDHEVNRELVRALLRPLNCVVDAVPDGPSAVEAVRALNYDLVLMDVQMPGMDGLAATRRIRQLEAKGGLPIIALTANVFPEQIQSYHAAGMNGHVGKPINARELLAAVSHWSDPAARGRTWTTPSAA